MLLYYSKRIVIVLVFVLLNAAWLSGQTMTRKQKRELFKADTKYEKGDFVNAAKIYETLLPLDSTSNELNYRIGVCKYEVRRTRESSFAYFKKVSPAAYPEVNYYMGKLHHSYGKFEEAIEYFHAYINFTGEKEHKVKEIEDLIEKCYYAILYTSAIVEDETLISNMGPAVNTAFPEYAPLIAASENKLYFTSRRKNDTWKGQDVFGDYYEDIYVSERVDGVWQKAYLLDSTVNSGMHDAATGISADGERMFIYHTGNDNIHGHIFESNLVKGNWTKPKKVDFQINSPDYNETSACFSPNGDMVFFSSDRPGGYGGKDLYCIKKAPGGKWAAPMNLGPTINTEYDEDAPFVHPFDSLLYFSSEGHKNLGGFDIFRSRYNEEGKYTTPENLGYPVNTVDDDIFFVMNVSGETGYLSSERDDSYGSTDLYYVNFSLNNAPLYVYNVMVYDEKGKVIPKTEIILNDADRRNLYGEYKSNPLSGKSVIISKPNRTYKVLVQADGYEPLIIDYHTLGETRDLSFVLTKKAK